MKPTNRAIRLRPDPFAGDDILARLRAPRKYLPCKLLYDTRGAALFEQICTVDEYYPYRSELALLEQHLPAIAAAIGPEARVIEPGSGAGRKTRMLLTALERPAVYIPIDVSAEQLADTARELHAAFPGLRVLPIAGDYNKPLVLPPARHAGRSLVFFPGSTIGNFEPEDAARFLARFAMLAGADASIVLGADSNDNPDELCAPTTTPRASPRRSISTCSRTSTARTARRSISARSSTARCGTPRTRASRCTCSAGAARSCTCAASRSSSSAASRSSPSTVTSMRPR